MDNFSIVVLALAVAYATGVLWYNILDRKYESWMRMAAFPLIGLVAAEGIWGAYGLGGPEFMGLHVVAMAFGTGIGALGDVVVQAIARESHVNKVVGVFSHILRG